MKKILTSTIAFFAELIALLLGVIWFLQDYEIEPLILVILSAASLVTSWLLKNASPKPKLDISLISKGKGHSNVTPSSKTALNEEGMPRLYPGHIIGKQEIYWNLTVKIVNNSTLVAFSPELYICPEFNDIIFIGTLDKNSPIKGTESVDLEIKFAKIADGDPTERKNMLTPNIPPEIVSQFKVIIKYATEDGSILLRQLEFVNEQQVNSWIRKVPKSFQKAKLFPRF